jgi:hypothetical protein
MCGDDSRKQIQRKINSKVFQFWLVGRTIDLKKPLKGQDESTERKKDVRSLISINHIS